MTTRRSFLEVAALALAAERILPGADAPAPFTLPPLPYAFDALEPYIDALTMNIHRTKHHQTCEWPGAGRRKGAGMWEHWGAIAVASRGVGRGIV